MGAPKQRWTPEEEAALKAGINKYGVGKWSTILKDPEIKMVLRSRSNVDLKDKWRNMNCMASGMGSRRAGAAAHRGSQVTPKHDEGSSVDSLVAVKDPVALDAKPIASVYVAVDDANLGNQITRVDDLILEAVTKLKEPRGSSRHAISEYIEDHHSMLPDLERTLTANLMALTEKGRLVKVKHQYRIAPRSITLDGEEDSTLLLADGAQDYGEGLSNGIIMLTKAQVAAELEKMMNMTAEEAAIVAAQAVAEAEAAMAAAEMAAVEAEEAEIEAEAARCFAVAAQSVLTCVSMRGKTLNARF